LLWLSAIAGGGASWVWLARQDEGKQHIQAAETELRQLTSLRAEFERAGEIRPGNFRIYAESGPRVAELVAKTPVDSTVREQWARELDYLKEASADLEWLQQRVRQLDVLQGSVLSTEVLANESTLRTGLNVLAEEPAGPGRHFRPGLARALRADLERRMTEVRTAAALTPTPPVSTPTPPVLTPRPVAPTNAPLVAKAVVPKPVKAIAKAGAPKKARSVSVKAARPAVKRAAVKSRKPTVAERLRAIREGREPIPGR